LLGHKGATRSNPRGIKNIWIPPKKKIWIAYSYTHSFLLSPHIFFLSLYLKASLLMYYL
jgi:hypothetical protein